MCRYQAMIQTDVRLLQIGSFMNKYSAKDLSKFVLIQTNAFQNRLQKNPPTLSRDQCAFYPNYIWKYQFI